VDEFSDSLDLSELRLDNLGEAWQYMFVLWPEAASLSVRVSRSYFSEFPPSVF
jgi:hypothetical protein